MKNAIKRLRSSTPMIGPSRCAVVTPVRKTAKALTPGPPVKRPSLKRQKEAGGVKPLISNDVTVEIVISAEERRKCRRYLDVEVLVREKIIPAHIRLLEILAAELENNETSH